jgi:hypothetical protein
VSKRSCWHNLILLLLLLTVAACSRSNTAPVAGLTAHYVESVNTVSGSFAVDGIFSYDKKPFNINPTQAYARVVKNQQDPNKKDALIVLVEKPLTRFALAVAENDDLEAATAELSDVLQNRDARGIVFRVAMDQSGNSDVTPYFNGNDYQFGNLVVEIKSLANDKVEGQVKSITPLQQADIKFSVRLQPDVWTGGAFYEQPPTNLSPGQASGQLVINDKAVTLTHAYARVVELDLFDENKNVSKVWLTEKPVDEKAFFDDRANNLLAMKNSGNTYVLTYNTTGPIDRSEANLWWLSQLASDAKDERLQASSDVFDQIPGIERDYVRYDNDAIEGRLFSAFPIHQHDRVYRLDLLFNAAMLPPAVTNGPVTANNGGTALPPDGGAPAKAYFSAIDRMKSAKGFDQKMAVWLTVVPAADAEKIKRDLESVSPAQRQMFLEVFAPLDDLKLAAGFMKDNKATLRFTGTGRDGKAAEVVNMHLEGDQWKIGRREIREE